MKSKIITAKIKLPVRLGIGKKIAITRQEIIVCIVLFSQFSYSTEGLLITNLVKDPEEVNSSIPRKLAC